MTSTQSLGVLFALALLSVLAALIYWLQVKMSIESRQRLRFLKAQIALQWTVGLAAIVILVSKSGQAIGNLVPMGTGLDRTLAGAQVRVLAWENEGAMVSRIVLGLYLIGLALMLARFVLSYLQMRKLLLRSSHTQIEGRSVQRVEDIYSPFAFGFLNPQIFVPSNFQLARTRLEIEIALTHEETHLKNRDPQWKLISLISRAILFFTPTSYILHRRLELEMEIECDRLSMQAANLSVREYGGMLIDTVASLQGRHLNPMLTYMSDTNLKERIQAMTTTTARRPILSVLLGVLTITIGLAAIAATAGVAKPALKYMIEAEVFVDGKLVSTPRFIVRAGEPAELEVASDVPKENLHMDLTAKRHVHDGKKEAVEVRMALQYKSDTRRAQGRASVIAEVGQLASIEMSDDDGSVEIKLKTEKLK